MKKPGAANRRRAWYPRWIYWLLEALRRAVGDASALVAGQQASRRQAILVTGDARLVSALVGTAGQAQVVPGLHAGTDDQPAFRGDVDPGIAAGDLRRARVD